MANYKKMIKILRSCKRRYTLLTESKRKEIYSVMQQSMETAMLFEHNQSAKTKFLQEVGKKKSDNLVLAVICFVMNAKSKHAKKLASKRSCALSYLVGVMKVPVQKIAEEIKKNGGVEALARKAAKHSPKKPGKDSAVKKTDDRAARPPKCELALSPKLRLKLESILPDRRVKIIAKQVPNLAGGVQLTATRVTRLKPKLEPIDTGSDWTD